MWASCPWGSDACDGQRTTVLGYVVDIKNIMLRFLRDHGRYNLEGKRRKWPFNLNRSALGSEAYFTPSWPLTSGLYRGTEKPPPILNVQVVPLHRSSAGNHTLNTIKSQVAVQVKDKVFYKISLKIISVEYNLIGKKILFCCHLQTLSSLKASCLFQ